MKPCDAALLKNSIIVPLPTGEDSPGSNLSDLQRGKYDQEINDIRAESTDPGNGDRHQPCHCCPDGNGSPACITSSRSGKLRSLQPVCCEPVRCQSMCGKSVRGQESRQSVQPVRSKSVCGCQPVCGEPLRRQSMCCEITFDLFQRQRGRCRCIAPVSVLGHVGPTVSREQP